MAGGPFSSVDSGKVERFIFLPGQGLHPGLEGPMPDDDPGQAGPDVPGGAWNSQLEIQPNNFFPPPPKPRKYSLIAIYVYYVCANRNTSGT